MEKPTFGPIQSSTLGGQPGGVQALYVDQSLGVKEEVCFFGPDRLKMFGCTHTPAGQPIGGVVICSTLDIETQTNYRREVLLAHALSARGFAVQRFHYRGLGNSDGDSRFATFETMREDALAAAEWLREGAGITNLAFVGTRWGALIAAAAAAQFRTAPIALWEPLVDTSRYFRDIFRRRLMSDLRRGESIWPSSLALVEELRQTGFVDVIGYRIDQPLYESAVGRTLAEELGGNARSVLLTQISMSQGLLPGNAALSAHWRRMGFSVETHIVEEEVTWGFFDDVWEAAEERPGTKRLIHITRDWLLRQFSSWRTTR
jgi:pimeloyl-ACP methyl ester carboxylesterase